MSVADALRLRTFEFAVHAVAFCKQLPQNWEAREIGRQLLRSSTSVAANYRAACRGRSRREFIAKLGIAVEEADETVFWLELIERTRIGGSATGGSETLTPLQREAQELLAILARSHRTARENSRAAGE